MANADKHFLLIPFKEALKDLVHALEGAEGADRFELARIGEQTFEAFKAIERWQPNAHDPRLDPGLDTLIQPLGGTMFPGDGAEPTYRSGNNANLWVQPEDDFTRTGYVATAGASDGFDTGNFANAGLFAERDPFAWEAVSQLVAFGVDGDRYAEIDTYVFVDDGGASETAQVGIFGYASTADVPPIFGEVEAYFEMSGYANEDGEWAWLQLRKSTDGGITPADDGSGLLYMTQTDDTPETYELRWVFPDDTVSVLAINTGMPDALDPRLGPLLDDAIDGTLFRDDSVWNGSGIVAALIADDATGYEAVAATDHTLATGPYGVATMWTQDGATPNSYMELYVDDNAGAFGDLYAEVRLDTMRMDLTVDDGTDSARGYLDAFLSSGVIVGVEHDVSGGTPQLATLQTISAATDSWSWLDLNPSSDSIPNTGSGRGLYMADIGGGAWELRWVWPDGTEATIAAS